MYFNENTLAVAESANWDYLKVRMCVVIDRNKDNSTDMDFYVGDSSPIIGGTDHSGINQTGIAFNTWVDVIVPKAVLNTPNSYILARNKITSVQDKQGFDDVFRAYTTGDTYNETNFFWFSDNVGPATEGNNATSVDVVPTLTYYIETIEWGVDVEAPDFTARPLRPNVSYQLIHTDIDAIHTANGKYSGIFEVTDDIIPTLQHYLSTYIRPNFSAKIYKVEGSARTEVTPVNGAYTFEEGYEYEADVTVDDRAVTNVACNTRTETVKLTVLGDNDIFSANNKGDASVFVPKQFGQGLLNTYEYVDSYSDGTVTKDGVVKATTHAWWNGSKNESWGGYVNGNFGYSAEQITAIATAIADSTKSVTLSFDLCVVKPTGSTITATKLNAQANSVNYSINYNIRFIR